MKVPRKVKSGSGWPLRGSMVFEAIAPSMNQSCFQTKVALKEGTCSWEQLNNHSWQ